MKGFHHFYLGIILLIIAFLLLFTKVNDALVIVTAIAATILCVDDFFQHWKQYRTSTPDPNYKSPLHRLYIYFLYNVSIIRKLNDFFDKLFGA